MKKILIIVGVLLLLIAGAVGVYISMNGVPQSVDEVFGKFTNSTDAPIFTEEDETDEDFGDIYEDEVDTSKKRLRQLTTRPTAGAIITDSTVRFVERGTGHIYEIDLRSGGEEKIISGTTQTRTLRAIFAQDGNTVALTSEEGGKLITKLRTYANGWNEVAELPERAEEIGFSVDGKNLHFFVSNINSSGGAAYAYSLEKGEAKEIFRLPMSDIRIQWGTTTYIHTIPSHKSIGYVYRVGKNGGLEYVTAGGAGLMAIHHASGTLVSTLENGEIVTRDTVTGEVPLLTLFTEKCTVNQMWQYLLICASPATLPETNVYPDDWYKGLVGFTDLVFSVKSASSTVTVLSNLERESGRPIDVSAIGTDSTGLLVYLINKYDNALWLLDLR